MSVRVCSYAARAQNATVFVESVSPPGEGHAFDFAAATPADAVWVAGMLNDALCSAREKGWRDGVKQVRESTEDRPDLAASRDGRCAPLEGPRRLRDL